MWKRLSLLVVLVSGCGAAVESGEAFLTALPSRQTLEVSVPKGPAALRDGSAALVGETAGLYVVTRQTTARVNGLVGGVLDQLGAIAHTRPAAVGPDSAAWGPFTDALSPVVWRLAVTRVGPGQHVFRLDVRPKAGSEEDFQPFLQGASEGPGPAGPNQGTFSVDLGLAHSLDPVGNPDDGQIVADWNAPGDRRAVHVRLDGVHSPSEAPTSADVVSALLPDGSGVLRFDALANFLGDGATLENGRVGARWNASGAGRADAEVHAGDGGAGGLVTECWDASFERVYFRGQASDGGSATEGDVSACAFADPVQ